MLATILVALFLHQLKQTFLTRGRWHLEPRAMRRNRFPDAQNWGCWGNHNDEIAIPEVVVHWWVIELDMRYE